MTQRGVGEMIRTYLTDTPPVDEGGSQFREILEKLGRFRVKEIVGFKGGEGRSV